MGVDALTDTVVRVTEIASGLSEILLQQSGSSITWEDRYPQNMEWTLILSMSLDVSACYVHLCLSYCGIMLLLTFHQSHDAAVLKAAYTVISYRETVRSPHVLWYNDYHLIQGDRSPDNSQHSVWNPNSVMDRCYCQSSPFIALR